MTLQQELREKFIEEHPLEAARYLEELPPQTMRDILQAMEPERIAQTVEHFLPNTTANILKQYPAETSATVLSRLLPGSARAILRQLDSSTQETLLGHLPPQTASFFRRTLHLAEHTAGSLADPQVLTLPPDITAKEALRRIRHVPNQVIYYLYILDHQNILKGVVLMKELLAAESTSTVSSVMTLDVKVIPSSAMAMDILGHHAWARFDSLPVIDQDKTFIGALRHRTLRLFLQSKSDEYQPAYLSDALLQLWEAYSLSGMVLMTTMGDVLSTARPPVPKREGQENP